MLAPFKKTAFFLNGGVYSLDEGLLMGDPFSLLRRHSGLDPEYRIASGLLLAFA
jgi:hypothetical protein